MDKYLDKDMEAFCKMLEDKGYKGHFLVNLTNSGELLPAMQVTVMQAHEQEYYPFPLILQTVLSDKRFENMPVVKLRVDHTDDGLKIRDAEVEGLMVKGKQTFKSISIAGGQKFPSKEQLLSKILNINKTKNKRKGL
ncbi:hypothetical protein [Pedobacter sp. ASV28]|uniref:hypothetical protein n=1 Tax=Pedobacter sp. ASV28 TaxID=2795123 RepID=UPI0018EBF671|nr:hypothetical protein [Pedobacter sp. ASV28]